MSDLIEHLELNTGPNPIGCVIWMHGLGADCWDFVPVIKELNLPAHLPLRFIFPQAPIRAITINGGHPMPGWYDIAMAQLERRADEKGIRESQSSIDALIAHQIKRGITSKKIVVCGFSQGGAMALQCGLRQANPLAGIIALSSYLPLPESLSAEKADANLKTPILMIHGSEDPVVPIDLAKQSRSILQQQQYHLDWHEFPMPHSVCREEIDCISKWLQRTLAN